MKEEIHTSLNLFFLACKKMSGPFCFSKANKALLWHNVLKAVHFSTYCIIFANWVLLLRLKRENARKIQKREIHRYKSRCRQVKTCVCAKAIPLSGRIMVSNGRSHMKNYVSDPINRTISVTTIKLNWIRCLILKIF